MTTTAPQPPAPASTHHPDPRALAASPAQTPDGLDDLAARALRRLRSRAISPARLMHEAASIQARTRALTPTADDELRAMASNAQHELRRRKPAQHAVHDAIALATEAARRTLLLDAHTNQIATALALARGQLVELATGEGKTLAAAIAATVEALRAPACHIVTANDYLAERDATETSPLFHFFGLTTAHITEHSSVSDRANAYNAHVCYATAREFVADFLRLRLTARSRQRPASATLHRLAPTLVGSPGQHPPPITPPYRLPRCVIVDEADFVLIDDAVTPLILSSPAEDTGETDAHHTAAREVASSLIPTADFEVDAAARSVRITARGRRAADNHPAWRATPNLAPRERDHLLDTALAAQHLFIEDRDYTISTNQGERTIVITDQATGRPAHERSWRGGIQQAVEAKHNITPTPPSTTSASISFQRYFRLPFKLAGLTGTAADARNEFADVYDLGVVSLPTHSPTRRSRSALRLFPTADGANAAAIREAQTRINAGQPVLIAADTVERSSTISRLLTERAINHTLLNATNNAEEAQAIANAGVSSAVTVATAIAGRGTDIKPDQAALDAGGLCVITLTPAVSRRYERQIVGRAARQGQPGHHVPLAAADDALLTKHTPILTGLITLGHRHKPTATQRPLPAPALAHALIRHAQRRAERRNAKARAALAKRELALDLAIAFAPDL